MMLNTDLCLYYQDNRLHADCMIETDRDVAACITMQKLGGYLYAHNASCCAWNEPMLMNRQID